MGLKIACCKSSQSPFTDGGTLSAGATVRYWTLLSHVPESALISREGSLGPCGVSVTVSSANWFAGVWLVQLVSAAQVMMFDAVTSQRRCAVVEVECAVMRWRSEGMNDSP